MGRYAKNRELKSGSYSVRIPIGSNSVGPNYPVDGLIRYNTNRKRPEVYFENRWRSMLGSEVDMPAKDTFYGDGVTTSFGPMSYPYPNGNEIFVLVFIHNVFQNPNSAYSVNNFTIDFTSPPPLNHPIIVLHGLVNGDAFAPLGPPPPTPPPPPVPVPVLPTPTPPGSPTPTPGPVPIPGPVIVSNFTNGTFETTTPTLQIGPEISIPGWKMYLLPARINGLSQIEGCPTASTNRSGYNFNDGGNSVVNYEARIVAEKAPNSSGVNGLLLFSIGSVTSSTTAARGPYIVSENYVSIATGDTLEINWKVENKPYGFYVNENYDVFMYLVGVGCNNILLLHETGSSKPWTKLSRTFSNVEQGSYKLVIISGSTDRSGGLAIGTQLYLDDIKLIKAITIN